MTGDYEMYVKRNGVPSMLHFRGCPHFYDVAPPREAKLNERLSLPVCTDCINRANQALNDQAQRLERARAALREAGLAAE